MNTHYVWHCARCYEVYGANRTWTSTQEVCGPVGETRSVKLNIIQGIKQGIGPGGYTLTEWPLWPDSSERHLAFLSILMDVQYLEICSSQPFSRSNNALHPIIFFFFFPFFALLHAVAQDLPSLFSLTLLCWADLSAVSPRGRKTVLLKVLKRKTKLVTPKYLHRKNGVFNWLGEGKKWCLLNWGNCFFSAMNFHGLIKD